MDNALFSLHGKHAIVTGASGGLGERMARVLHAAGATVTIAARRMQRLKLLADELGPRVTPIECDVSKDSDCERLVSEAVRVGDGALDILINNAGIGDVGPAEQEPPEQFRQVIEVNLNATFVLSSLAARSMLKQGSGSIINIASVLGLVASWPIKQAGYAASKGAVVNLTRELACQWAKSGVRVNAIAPGWFRSEMTGEMFDSGGMSFIERNAPIARAGQVHELDGVVLFLASAASTYVIGQTIAVDGGWTAR